MFAGAADATYSDTVSHGIYLTVCYIYIIYVVDLFDLFRFFVL